MKSQTGRRAAFALFLLATVVATTSFAPQAETEEQRFFRAADETLARVAEITRLTPKRPIARSVKSREEIRAYIVAELHDELPPEKMHADQIALEKFGLIPKGFPLEKFTIDLLSEQVAALYDPKKKEFYIADWIPVELQRTVMAHELTHALQDQYVDLEKWLKEVKDNDDALLARTAIAEGSATAVMLDYLLSPQGKRVQDLPEAEELVRSGLLGQLESESVFGQAPRYLRDSLLFPYLDGVNFTQRFLARNDWKSFESVFKNPPTSSQEIMHPEKYFDGDAPEQISLPDLTKLLPDGWKRLDDNVAGEFATAEILRQFLDEKEISDDAGEWRGDRYEVLENSAADRTMIVFRTRWATPVAARKFFLDYVALLPKKYQGIRKLSSVPARLVAQPAALRKDDAVLVRVRGREVLVVEGAAPAILAKIERAIWPAKKAVQSAAFRVPSGLRETGLTSATFSVLSVLSVVKRLSSPGMLLYSAHSKPLP